MERRVSCPPWKKSIRVIGFSSRERRSFNQRGLPWKRRKNNIADIYMWNSRRKIETYRTSFNSYRGEWTKSLGIRSPRRNRWNTNREQHFSTAIRGLALFSREEGKEGFSQSSSYRYRGNLIFLCARFAEMRVRVQGGGVGVIEVSDEETAVCFNWVLRCKVVIYWVVHSLWIWVIAEFFVRQFSRIEMFRFFCGNSMKKFYSFLRIWRRES